MLTINDNDFDFIDFGASKGGCIDFAQKRLGGLNGLGIDIDPKKVLKMKGLGHECIKSDITNLEMIPDKSVRFVTISHVLEHLPDIFSIIKTLREAIRVSTDFIFIQGPYYDSDEYLANKGLKFFWSDWRGHSYHLRVDEMNSICEKNLNLFEYKTMLRIPINDSNDHNIHPIDSPRDQHEYNPDLHPSKEIIHFDLTVYKEFVTCIQIRNLNYWNDVVHARGGCIEI